MCEGVGGARGTTTTQTVAWAYILQLIVCLRPTRLLLGQSFDLRFINMLYIVHRLLFISNTKTRILFNYIQCVYVCVCVGWGGGGGGGVNRYSQVATQLFRYLFNADSWSHECPTQAPPISSAHHFSGMGFSPGL